jgi:queuine tRNA-ribosyltransferase
MPVGTQGTVKALEQRELVEIDARIILSNTYHLYLRPGHNILRSAGGLHKFASWDRAILTDSGGFQVFSLSDLRSIDDEGVVFRSHLDGSSHRFTPENVVEIQRAIGSDIMMQLDECISSTAAYGEVARAVKRTIDWAERSIEAYSIYGPLFGYEQMLFGIVQGGVHEALREQCAGKLMEMPFHGYAIGGLAVGEPPEEMYRIAGFTADLFSETKVRYLMGVGTPENLLRAIGLGKEILGLQLATIHNITYYINLMRDARQAIVERRYQVWMKDTINGWNKRETRN